MYEAAILFYSTHYMVTTYEVKDIAELPAVVADILGVLKKSQRPGEASILVLSGDLGAGKTTFTQELARQLGVKDLVQSPTFTILKRYETEDADFTHLIHMDAYRIESVAELVPLRFSEVCLQPRGLLCLEWGERIASVLPARLWRLSIVESIEGGRTFSLQQSS